MFQALVGSDAPGPVQKIESGGHALLQRASSQSALRVMIVLMRLNKKSAVDRMRSLFPGTRSGKLWSPSPFSNMKS